MNRFLKKLFFIVVLAHTGFAIAHAQSGSAVNNQVVIKGRITEKRTKAAMQGVSISEIDAEGRIVKGAQTDIEGNFILRMTNSKNKISASFVGYKSNSVNINGRTTINFELEAEGRDMESVVV